MIAASIVIPTYNRSQSLRRALTSILEVDFPKSEFEVVIVDNNSNDDTPQVVDEFRGKGLNMNYVRETRLSFTVARHTGAESARTDLLCYLDDDVIVDKKWLRSIVNYFNSDLKIGMIAGRIEPHFEQVPPAWAVAVQKKFNGWSLWHYAETVCESPGACGPNLAVRKRILQEVGGFPPDTIGGESKMKPGTVEKIYIGPGDWGLGRKVKNAGYRILYVPDAMVYHVVPPVRLTLDWWESRFVGEGYMKAFSDQVWFHRSRFVILQKSLSSRLIGWLTYVLYVGASIIRLDGRYFYRFVSSYMRTKSKVEFALFRDPKLAARLWDTALKGIQPDEIDDLKKQIP